MFQLNVMRGHLGLSGCCNGSLSSSRQFLAEPSWVFHSIYLNSTEVNTWTCLKVGQDRLGACCCIDRRIFCFSCVAEHRCCVHVGSSSRLLIGDRLNRPKYGQHAYVACNAVDALPNFSTKDTVTSARIAEASRNKQGLRW
jgi:hypothetical protein